MPPPNDFGWAGGFVGRRSFRQLLAEAIEELSRTGYISADRLEWWVLTLRRAAEESLGSERFIDEDTRRKLGHIFEKLVEREKIAEYVPGVSRFTLSMVRPDLRAELDRRILASADLIKLHRREAIERTLQRFRGWSTSIPPGGEGVIDKRETQSHIAKSLAQYRFEKRRVDIDQGHKLLSNINEIVATDAGAIAGVWHDHGEHDKGYDARKEHLARSGRLFLVRDSWAIEQGLVRRGSRPYMDEIERPGQLPFCRCFYRWITSPRRLPDEVLTSRGQEWVAGERMAA